MKVPEGFVVLRDGIVVRRGHEQEIDAFLGAASADRAGAASDPDRSGQAPVAQEPARWV